MAEAPDNPCARCGGTGDDGSGFCLGCLGTGKQSTAGRSLFFKALYDHITTKCDALQADMDIIKPQIQAIYDDLNP